LISTRLNRRSVIGTATHEVTCVQLQTSGRVITTTHLDIRGNYVRARVLLQSWTDWRSVAD